MRQMTLLKAIILAIFGLSLVNICSAKVAVNIKPHKITVDTSFRLSFSYPGKSNGFMPNFSPLNNDFTILSTGKRSAISVINGQVSSKVMWQLLLQAKKPGTFLIPAISFGGEASEPFKVFINKSAATNAAKLNTKAIFMKTSVDSKSGYIQSGFIYRVKLYYAKRLVSGSFSSPSAKDALIIQLGESNSYQTTIKGKTYHVAEQDFAVFPEKSGTLRVTSPIFRGMIESNPYSNLSQIIMDVQKPITVTTSETEIKVLPIPTSFNGQHWLPAKTLNLSESWTGLDKPLEVGEPITRVLHLKAVGLTAEQLPAFDLSSKDNVNVYKQKPILKNSLENGSIIGEKRLKVTYIPSKAGALKLPELVIPWWDTQRNIAKKARIQGKQLTILGHQTNKPESSKPQSPPPNLPSSSIQPFATLSLAAALMLFAVILLITLKKLIRYKKISDNVKRHRPRKGTPFQRQLKKACGTNDAKKAHEVVLTWAKHHFNNPNILSLGEIKARIKYQPFTNALNELERSLYTEQKQWEGSDLWVTWLVINKKKQKKTKNASQLPPINP